MAWLGMESSRETKHPGRRSRLDIACDILKAISEGIERPTRIMSLSNLSWPLTIAYLGALVRSNMIAVVESNGKHTYRLTPKGSALLSLYRGLQEAVGELELDKVDLKQFSETFSTRRVPVKGGQVDSVKKILEKIGRVSSTNVQKGASGVTHAFDLVMSNRAGDRTGYLIMEKVAETDVVRAFVMKTDCEIQVCIVCDEFPQREILDIAESYDIDIVRYKDLAGANFALRVVAQGRNCILEVEPDSNYEVALRDFALELASKGRALVVFTSKGSPIHAALETIPEARFYLMTPQVSYQKATEKPSEILVPLNDLAVLLDALDKVVTSSPDRKVAVLFDTISDLILSSGFEGTFKFMKQASEILSGIGATSIFLVTAGAHEEKAIRLIKNLFAVHLAFGGNGFSVSKES